MIIGKFGIVWYGDLFFQAEDGIRDLVRSRGLGDVYKRQELGFELKSAAFDVPEQIFKDTTICEGDVIYFKTAVSYTHLTLPTSDLV